MPAIHYGSSSTAGTNGSQMQAAGSALLNLLERTPSVRGYNMVYAARGNSTAASDTVPSSSGRAAGGIYAGLLRGGTAPAEGGILSRGSKAVGGAFAGLLRGGGTSGSSGGSGAGKGAAAADPAAAAGAGFVDRKVARIPEGTDFRHAGKGCDKGCEKFGTCDRELGVCRCKVLTATISGFDLSMLSC